MNAPVCMHVEFVAIACWCLPAPYDQQIFLSLKDALGGHGRAVAESLGWTWDEGAFIPRAIIPQDLWLAIRNHFNSSAG